MKRISAFTLVLAAIVSAGSLVSCSKKSGPVVVGIAKFVSHPALDALEKGVQDEILAAKKDVQFDLQNANADMSTATQIAQRFKSSKVSVAVGIATPTAQSLANAIKDIPVVYCAVTDPVSAGLVESFDKGGRNVTGTSDMTPVREQLDLLLTFKPKARIGHIYNAGEANSVKLAEMVQAYCAEKGLEYVPATVTNSAEVRQALLSIVNRIDGVYLGNDNTVFSAINAVAEICNEKKIPLVTADPSSAETVPVLAAMGFNYYAMGRATGKIVLRILDGEKTANIPTYFAKDPSEMALVLNKDVAATIGVTISADLEARASLVISGGVAKRK
jgi:putative tryptophan/tyrosine transport system substrate-binding protein